MTLWILTALQLLLGAIAPQSEKEADQRHFTVWKGTDKVGTLTTWQRYDEGRTVYFLSSDVSVDFVWSIKIKEEITDVFEKGRLTASSHQRFVNDDLKVSNLLVKAERGYQVMNQDEDVIHLDDSIVASVLSIYFHEPVCNQQVYSQNFRQMVMLKKVRDHVFQIDLPNGSTTVYSYRNEQLVAVESKMRLGTVKFIIEQDTEFK
jgi:hypothetical protein